ncbi:hypothetical protein [Lentzea sp. NPDC092896]|uniref:hypothetical protein n=1 Tax=Lentzea sp. NPDC092896 TaxID=3364127 RepID=UPI00381EE067
MFRSLVDVVSLDCAGTSGAREVFEPIILEALLLAIVAAERAEGLDTPGPRFVGLVDRAVPQRVYGERAAAGGAAATCSERPSPWVTAPATVPLSRKEISVIGGVRPCSAASAPVRCTLLFTGSLSRGRPAPCGSP